MGQFRLRHDADIVASHMYDDELRHERPAISDRLLMIGSSPPTLDYHVPRRRPAGARQIFLNGRTGAYAKGLGLGTALLLLILSLKMGYFIEQLLTGGVILALLSVAGLLATVLLALREHVLPGAAAYRLFWPLVTVLYYPVAHSAFCRIAAVLTGQ